MYLLPLNQSYVSTSEKVKMLSSKFLSEKAPHLHAIVRRRKKTEDFRENVPNKMVLASHQALLHASLPPEAFEFRPSSTSAFLSRLATFKLSTYSITADELNAVAAARHGWVNDGKNRLVCGFCTSDWIVGKGEGLKKASGTVLMSCRDLY